MIVLVSELDKWLRDSRDQSKIAKWGRCLKKTLPAITRQSAVVGAKLATFGALDLQAEYERTTAEFTGNIACDLLENFNKQSKAIEQFKKIITEALEALPSEQKNLVIFIDELDRCRPTYAIELLERIKHLFSINRLVFVLSTDTTQLVHSICAVYGSNFDAKKYLQRFIDLDYSLKKSEREKYIDILFTSLGIDEVFRTTKHFKNEIEQLKKCLIFLVKRFDLKLRDINLLLMRIRLILYSIPNNHFLDAPLLVSLLVLRDQNKELYDRYVSSPSVADDVIDFLCKGFLPLKKNDDELSDIIGYLIAPNNDQSETFECLIKPYRDAISAEYDINDIVVKTIKNPRKIQLSFMRDALNITVERIELVQRINIEN